MNLSNTLRYEKNILIEFAIPYIMWNEQIIWKVNVIPVYINVIMVLPFH